MNDQPHPFRRDLQADRPNPPEIRGVPCMRCNRLTESISCILYPDYWLCPSCTRFHHGIQNKATRMQQYHQDYGLTAE